MAAKLKSEPKTAKTQSKTRFETRSKDLPATQGMLQLVRNELKSDTQALRSEMNSQFKQVDSKIEQVLGVVHQVAAEVARVGTLVEEQNSRNEVVLEGLSVLFHRQDLLLPTYRSA